MAPALGIGLSSGTRVGFGYAVRLWAFGFYVRESIENAGMRDSFGIAQLSGKPGEERKYCKISRKELEARRWESVCFPLVSRECSRGKERLTWSSVVPHGWI